MGVDVDFVASVRVEVGQEGSEGVPGHRHGHKMPVGVIRRPELNQVGLDIDGVRLP